MNKQQLIEEIARNIRDRDTHENDASYYEDMMCSEGDELQFEEYEDNMNDELEQAHQLTHVIRCDLLELADLIGETLTEEKFREVYNIS